MQNNKNKNVPGILLGIIFAISLLVAGFLTSMELTIYGNLPDSFLNECEKYGALEEVGISREDMAPVTVRMFEYLRGNEDSLEDIRATIKGKPDTPFFNEKECLHMEDCRKLFTAGFKLRNGAVIVCLAVLVLIFLIYRKDTDSALHCIAKGTLIGTLAGLGVLILLGILAAADFDKCFTKFHLIFFDNDLWLLDPAKDRLLMVMPTGYFIDCVKTIGIYFGIGLAAILIISILRLQYERKRDLRTAE